MSAQFSGKIVSVIGGSDAPASLLADAKKIGRYLGAEGYTIACGGRGGVMEAVCAGAREAGSATIGILPGSDRSEANPFVDIAIPTGIGLARNSIVAMTGDVVVAIGGKFGTLSEIAYSLLYSKIVIAYKSWEIAREKRTPESYLAAESPEQVLEMVKRALPLPGR